VGAAADAGAEGFGGADGACATGGTLLLLRPRDAGVLDGGAEETSDVGEKMALHVRGPVICVCPSADLLDAALVRTTSRIA